MVVVVLRIRARRCGRRREGLNIGRGYWLHGQHGSVAVVVVEKERKFYDW